MTKDESIGEQISNALFTNDIHTFERLLRSHPNELRTEDGTTYWLDHAAGEGLLPFVELLVQMGVGVNESIRADYPQTAIDRAAGKGHLDVVRWLLDHGATINWTIEGERKCPALLGAAEGGHLEVVKLLVERGAEFNADQAGISPLDWAIRFGHKDVVDYLRSIGAQTVFERVPVNLPARHAELKRLMARLHAPLSSFELPRSSDAPFTVHATEAGKKRGIRTIFTVGMSDRDLEVPGGGCVLMELRVRLAKDWPDPEKAVNDPRWSWPFHGIHKIAREALTAGTWPDRNAAVFMNGDPPEPLAPGTGLAGWVVLSGSSGNYQMPDQRWVDIRDMVAIYREEHDLIRFEGYAVFVRRLHDRRVPDCLVPDRPNVAK